MLEIYTDMSWKNWWRHSCDETLDTILFDVTELNLKTNLSKSSRNRFRQVPREPMTSGQRWTLWRDSVRRKSPKSPSSRPAGPGPPRRSAPPGKATESGKWNCSIQFFYSQNTKFEMEKLICFQYKVVTLKRQGQSVEWRFIKNANY